MSFNTRSYLFILPVALGWFVTGGSPQLVLTALLVMALAETLRQYLAAAFVREASAPKQLFFFGVIYKDSHGIFSGGGPTTIVDQPRSRKFLMLAGVYFLSLLVRFSPPFANVSLLQVALFCLVVTIWVYSATYRSLSRLLLFQLLLITAIFLATEEASTAGFILWLLLSLWVQQQLHGWQLAEQTKTHTDDFSIKYSASEFIKSALLMLILFVSFRVVDFFVPGQEEPPAQATGGPANATFNYTALKKRPALPKKLLNKAAKLKLHVGAVDLKKLGTFKDDMKLPSLPQVTPTEVSTPPTASPFAFGENRQELEDLRQTFSGDKPLTDADFEKFRAFSKKVRTPVESPSAGSPTAAADAPDVEIEERISKLKSLQPDESEILPSTDKNAVHTEDDAAAYVRSRNELASEVDKLMVQDQKNTLAKEEQNLQKYFERMVTGLKKFSVLMALAALLAYWLARKSGPVAIEEQDKKAFSLPKEVRMRLKTLYKLLLVGNFSPKDEVIKSFYIVELAFKEIEFGREEDLPPLNFLEKLQRDLPFVASAAKTPIDLFSRVFYGDKTPDETHIRELRSSMQELMKKLRVV